MTNAEKYLKDGVDLKELSRELFNYIVNNDTAMLIKIRDFFEKPCKPTLTEDERVILKNIKGQPKYISRQKGYGLIAYDKAKRETKTGWSYDNGREMSSFSHLFQFIKEGEEYNIQELLGDEK